MDVSGRGGYPYPRDRSPSLSFPCTKDSRDSTGDVPAYAADAPSYLGLQ